MLGYTFRQIILFYKEAIALDNEKQIRHMIAVNKGIVGGKEAEEQLKLLSIE